MRGLPLLLALALPCYPGEGRYLQVVRQFVDTMVEHGTDRYGAVHSPLFAAMLDLETLSLPLEALPPEFFKADARQRQAFGFGLPNPPVGIRPGDRAPMGNNLEHDINLLRVMYELAAITGEKKYAAHADAYIRFWLLHCQSPETGLMASGEHNSWDFVRERAWADTHEVYRRFPFWDKLYGIDPHRAARLADAMWMSQIGNKKVGDFSRHAGYFAYRAETGAAYPRHAGFYIWAYANAYVQTRDPKFVNRAEVLIESRTGRRPQPLSLLVDRGSFEPEKSLDATLRLMLWDAAGLVPERRDAWRGIVRELDEEDFARSGTALRIARAAAPAGGADANAEKYKGMARPGTVLVTAGGARTISETLSPIWRMSYGSSGVSGRALLHLTRYRQTGDARFLARAEAIADAFVEEGLPKVKDDIWPGAAGQVISLLVSLSGDRPAKAPRYMAFARDVAGMSIALFSRNGLFRADGSSRHYEAITGADDLLWGLLQLDCVESQSKHRLGHNDVNW
ncbi:MAG: hypothetical protein ACE15B_10535 [Bryobacteraceae bacterium]